MNKVRQSAHEELTDLVVDGFKRLNNNILDKKPPKFKWLEGFDRKEDKVKFDYLKNLSSTMNNAARLMQDERDELVRLMVLKEKQLEAMAVQLRANNVTVQNQVTKMNEQRQNFINELSLVTKELKDLKAKGH